MAAAAPTEGGTLLCAKAFGVLRYRCRSTHRPHPPPCDELFEARLVDIWNGFDDAEVDVSKPSAHVHCINNLDADFEASQSRADEEAVFAETSMPIGIYGSCIHVFWIHIRYG